MAAPAFPKRLFAAMDVAIAEKRSPERRMELLSVVIEGAKVSELREFLASAHGVHLPASAKRAAVVAEVKRVIAA